MRIGEPPKRVFPNPLNNFTAWLKICNNNFTIIIRTTESSITVTDFRSHIYRISMAYISLLPSYVKPLRITTMYSKIAQGNLGESELSEAKPHLFVSTNIKLPTLSTVSFIAFKYVSLGTFLRSLAATACELKLFSCFLDEGAVIGFLRCSPILNRWNFVGTCGFIALLKSLRHYVVCSQLWSSLSKMAGRVCFPLWRP